MKILARVKNLAKTGTNWKKKLRKVASVLFAKFRGFLTEL